MRISLAGPSYVSGSVNAAAQQCMNLVPEIIEGPGEPVRMVLYGRPGIQFFCAVQPKIRAMWAGGGRLFVVNGPTLTEVHQDGSRTDRVGTLATTSDYPDAAQIFSNGHQLLVISGGQAYCDNGAGPVPCLFQVAGVGNTVAAGATLNWVSGPQFENTWPGKGITINGRQYMVVGFSSPTSLSLDVIPPNEQNVPWAIAGGDPVDARTGGFIDGYFVVSRVPQPGVAGDPGRQFNISGLYEGTEWDPLMYAVKEGRPDYIQSVLCDHEQLVLFGTESTEIWQNVGGTVDNPFPFQRIAGAFIQDGSAAMFAPCSVGPTFCWLGSGPDGQTRAYRAQGLQPVRISTHAQESMWNAPAYRVRDAVSYSYVDGGHQFWVVNFWQQQHTWVYDMVTEMWHERALWNPGGLNFLRYQPWYHAFVPEWGDGGMHVVGSPESGKLWQMSSGFFDDDGVQIQYQRAFPHLISENQWGYHHRLEVMAEMGALTAGQPIPVMGLDWSDDHGHSFAGTPVSRLGNMAPAGNYTQRAVFRRLGKARDRVYRVGVTARTKVALIDAYLEMTQGFA